MSSPLEPPKKQSSEEETQQQQRTTGLANAASLTPASEAVGNTSKRSAVAIARQESGEQPDDATPKKKPRTEAQVQGDATSPHPSSDKKPKAKTTDKDDTGTSSDDPECVVVNVPLFENHMRFPDQLWELLKYPEELEDAIWWMPGNDAFAINETNFSKKLLESHFRGNKFSSIIRKLNRWGFRKYVDRSLPPKTVAYYHRSFQKGRSDLVKTIEKEEGKIEQSDHHNNDNSMRSQFSSLFQEATTSQRIPHVFHQPGTPITATHVLAAGNNSPFAARLAAAGLGNASAAAGTTSSLDRLTGLTSPLNQRHHSAILQSIFGQRVGSTTTPATTLGGLAAASPTVTGSQQQDNSSFLRLAQLQRANQNVEQQALLHSMVSNIERERQQQQQRQQRHDEGRLLLALERERSRRMVQEQKEPESFSSDRNSGADASLFSLMTTGQRGTYLGIQQQQQEQPQEQANRLLAAAACRPGEDDNRGSLLLAMGRQQQQQLQQQQQQQQQQRADFTNQLQLRRQLETAISSPNPFLSPLSHQTSSGTAARRVLGQDSLPMALPADLLLSPQQRFHQVLQLQQRREEDQSRNQLPRNYDGRP